MVGDTPLSAATSLPPGSACILGAIFDLALFACLDVLAYPRTGSALRLFRQPTLEAIY